MGGGGPRPAPAWLTLSPETLDLASSWMFAPNWPQSRDVWSQNAEVLSSEETATALEELALLDSRTAQQHAALREAVLAHGVTAAYDPLILAEQMAQWVDCATWAESRAFLQDHPASAGHSRPRPPRSRTSPSSMSPVPKDWTPRTAS
ncbi:hypothetical protein NKH18_12105 [Streptomyces sp. M10(2022)]